MQDLEAVRHRARSFGNVLIMLEAPTVTAREVAGRDLEARLRQLDRSLVSSVSLDEHAAARFGWEHRFLFADLTELTKARDALAARLDRAKLAANPLYIDVEDGKTAASQDLDAQLATIEQRLADAERLAIEAPVRLSPDGRSQLFVLGVTFPSSDTPNGRKVMKLVHDVGAAVATNHPGVRVEYAGNVNFSLLEHDSVISGMLRAAIVTIILVGLGLFAYYRAVLPILAALTALLVGFAATMIFAYLAIGHLNLLSAFLTAIVIGNGINPGLIVLARYFEELRNGTPPAQAVKPAMVGSLYGTLGASFAAAVAYAALVVTDFRGFRHFGIIGGVGMVLCWLATYSVLPVLLEWLARRGWIRTRPRPLLGDLVARLGGSHLGWVLGVGAAVTALSLVVTIHYVLSDPFEKDWRGLQPTGAVIRAQHEVDARMSARFDRGVLGGHSYQLAIALDHREQVRPLVAQLRERDAKLPPERRLFVDIKSIADLVPPDQTGKLAVLTDLRRLLSDPAIESLEPRDRERLAKLMPPADLRTITEQDVPEDLLRPFVEQDGTVGRLIYVKGSPRFDTWNVDDRVKFAAAVRQLPLPAGARIAGEPLVIADIVESMARDAPVMIGAALLGAILVVGLTVGRRRHGVVTIICALSGMLVMIALCALVGLKVHFLDLIALPITIGIGIDYAINLAARDRDEPGRGARYLLSTTGGAVLLCSYTTTVGYGSLLLSSNGGVRAFGLAAILGELACVTTALLIAPALLSRTRR